LAESLDFCTNVLVARVLGVPYVVMPQSIGPLDYSLGVGLLLRPLVRRALASATLLWAREPGALATAQQHRGAQARLAPDIVLAHRDRRPERIYRAGHGPRIVDVPEHFACVIPSGHILKRRGADGFDEFYSAAVRRVLSSGREVLLLPHSAHDLALCARIAGIVADERVTVAAHDLDAIELESVIGRADFVVASRYHSLVHAYRQAVPAVVVGWAEKYEAVAALVGQERFVFPVDVDVATALSAIDELASRHAEESTRIRERLAAGFPDVVREVVDTLAGR
jgi:colanic acid/amylovoran biosynthesis protein